MKEPRDWSGRGMAIAAYSNVYALRMRLWHRLGWHNHRSGWRRTYVARCTWCGRADPTAYDRHPESQPQP